MRPVEISVRVVLDEESYERTKKRISTLHDAPKPNQCISCMWFKSDDGYHTGHCGNQRTKRALFTPDGQYLRVDDSFGCNNHTKMDEVVHE